MGLVQNYFSLIVRYDNEASEAACLTARTMSMLIWQKCEVDI